MVPSAKRFAKDETGALLVFFAICCAAIFLLAALSFDIGRRASTQSELQSFVDNVALAAAGELNGFPGALQRSQNAANDLIRDRFAIGGNGDTDLDGESFHLDFYSTLPAADFTPMTRLPADGWLDPGEASNDLVARFVRISMINDERGDKRVQVPWAFARLLSIFSTDDLPTEMVGAEAVAGFTSLACDVSPIFFCMPPTPASGEPWDPSANIGQTIRLVAEGGNGNGGDWHPGNFAWLDVFDQVPAEDLTDPGGPCYGLRNNDLYACLVAGQGALSLCFENGYLSTMTGRAEGWRPTTLNSFFDMYDSAQMDMEDDPRYPPAPVVTKSYVDGSTCGNNSSPDTTSTTMDLPPDDCFRDVGVSECTAYSGAGDRYGDSDWTQGRIDYVEANYSVDPDSLGRVEDHEEWIDDDGTMYHVDDPFRPGATNILAPVPPLETQPVVRAGPDTTRWQYYNAEVATSLYSNSGAYSAGPDVVPNPRPGGPLDLIKDIYINPGDANPAYVREGSSLPSCSTDNAGNSLASDDPRRRVITAAAVDCEYWSSNANPFGRDQLNGRSGQFLAQYFVELFLLNPARPSGTTRELYAEVISGALNGGTDNVAEGTFRNLVQLYR
ncbi:TadE/TadG family type IV pilus assembly protein [Silicimonas algicola]|uniref:Putative Flp pilus-assembly TadE/G-like protein n=1 Tax=Silicimonas algicola TaxID=1826607 RepID=A0A316G8C1_9RHOB|nr:pilus assembly protein TadG-related protein [Silicimonas algicola]PWK56852.1 putative Flp pilus-assembly TadE/G-like protein [Silicimonas algicola]